MFISLVVVASARPRLAESRAFPLPEAAKDLNGCANSIMVTSLPPFLGYSNYRNCGFIRSLGLKLTAGPSKKGKGHKSFGSK